ncbi:hypothetical protein [Micromonospora wenchangensis]|uniref:hypothetical protein n=1 Tax=Micromonospora wenchangensis TaxID=1185415 RepID=UPI00342EB0A3
MANEQYLSTVAQVLPTVFLAFVIEYRPSVESAIKKMRRLAQRRGTDNTTYRSRLRAMAPFAKKAHPLVLLISTTMALAIGEAAALTLMGTPLPAFIEEMLPDWLIAGILTSTAGWMFGAFMFGIAERLLSPFIEEDEEPEGAEHVDRQQ